MSFISTMKANLSDYVYMESDVECTLLFNRHDLKSDK